MNEGPSAFRLEGVLERVVYLNEESAWSVVRLAVPGRREPVTAVGNLLGVQPGENLRLTGRWILDRRFGEQFQVEAFETLKPATLVGIERYLGSGLVRGLGPVMAKRLVEEFGVFLADPGALTQRRNTAEESVCHRRLTASAGFCRTSCYCFHERPTLSTIT